MCLFEVSQALRYYYYLFIYCCDYSLYIHSINVECIHNVFLCTRSYSNNYKHTDIHNRIYPQHNTMLFRFLETGEKQESPSLHRESGRSIGNHIKRQQYTGRNRAGTITSARATTANTLRMFVYNRLARVASCTTTVAGDRARLF